MSDLLVGQLRVCGDCARSSPDEFTYLNTAARPMLKQAANELERLRKIEAAAIAWRRSLEGDDWSIEAIENDVCRPGMSDLLRLVSTKQPTSPRHTNSVIPCSKGPKCNWPTCPQNCPERPGHTKQSTSVRGE